MVSVVFTNVILDQTDALMCINTHVAPRFIFKIEKKV